MGVPKFPKLGLPRFWDPITLCADLWLKWSLKQSCSPHWNLSNGMSHATWTQGNRVDSRLLVVGSQTANLTLGLSFGQNLCFRCPNGSCEPILDIYVSIAFQWNKEIFKPMGFDPCNRPLKIWESIGTPTFIWECEGSFPHTLLHSREHEMWPLGFLLGPQPCKPLPWLRA
jgi:hypothetical protein